MRHAREDPRADLRAGRKEIFSEGSFNFKVQHLLMVLFGVQTKLHGLLANANISGEAVLC